MTEYLLVFLIGLGASFFGSFISGGVSAIAIPLLIAIGLPPHVALGTFGVGAFGFDIGGMLQYQKNRQVVWKYVLPLTIIVIPTAILGSLLVLNIDPVLVSTIIGTVILAFIPITFYKPDLGVVRHSVTKTKERLGYVAHALVTVYGTSFSVGAGLFWTYTMMYFYGLELIESKGTLKIPSFTSAVVKVAVFGLAGAINWPLAGVLLIGTFMGAYAGTHYAILAGNVWLRRILLLSMAILGLQLIWSNMSAII